MLTFVRFMLCVWVAVAPIQLAWTMSVPTGGSTSDSQRHVSAASVELAQGHVIGAPAEGTDHEDTGQEEAALDADDHRALAAVLHAGVFLASDERAIHYPTDRPPRRIRV